MFLFNVGPNFAEDLIHVATVNPMSVVTMSPYKDKATYLSLQGLLGSYRYARSRVSLVPLVGNQKGLLLVHEGSVRVKMKAWKVMVPNKLEFVLTFAKILFSVKQPSSS